MRALLPYLSLLNRYKWILILGIILSIITLLSSVNILVLSGWFLSATVSAGSSGLYSFNYMLPAVGIRSIAIIRIVGRYFERIITHDATFRILQHLRVFTFSRLIPLSPGGLIQFRRGELLNRIVADIDMLDHFYLRVVLPLLSAFVVIIIITTGLSLINTTFAITLGAILITTLFLFPLTFYQIGKINGENLSHLRSKYCQHLIDWLEAQVELKLFGAKKHYRAQIDSIERQWQSNQRKSSSLVALSQALMLMISGITTIVTLWMTSDTINSSKKVDPLITVFVFSSIAIFEALIPVTSIFQYLGKVIYAASRITQLIKQPPEVLFTKKYTPEVSNRIELHLQNITFSYRGRTQPALNNLSLDVHAGEHIAIIGCTGCGKSTLLQLITRAWDPCQGSISINGVSLVDFSESTLRCVMGVVTQRIHLFSATLRENLILAAPHAEDAQIIAVLEKVGLQKLLLGKGLNSHLGEGGRLISIGELRRLAIARVLLKNAPLILLDEPTEGLDEYTEKKILKLLQQEIKNKTVLMVTHRLHNLANFDRIIVMEDGKIIEQGNHKNLLIKRGRYYQLIQRI